MDASDKDSVSVDNQRVTQWRDKSGNNHSYVLTIRNCHPQGRLSGNFMQFGGGSLVHQGVEIYQGWTKGTQSFRCP